MNKKAKRRAFFICAAIFVMYVGIGLGFTEKLSMKRIARTEEIQAKTMGLAPSGSFMEGSAQRALTVTPASAATPPQATAIPPPKTAPPGVASRKPPKAPEPKPAAPATLESPVPQAEMLPPVTAFAHNGVSAEPGILIAIPIVCHAIREGAIEKEGLIFIRKGGYNNLSWKKPLDILKDRDEEGLKSISKAIGKKQILGFLKKEGITQTKDTSADDAILGRGYTVEKKRLLGLYDKYVSADYQGLFPFFLSGVGIAKGKNGFEVIRARDMAKERRTDGEEWMMPNLTNLTIRDAIAKLSARTSKIKVFGNGTVADQHPRPFQRTQGETECIIYGRTDRQ